jgi:hypothetical protein
MFVVAVMALLASSTPLFAENTARAFPEQTPYVALDIAIIAAVLTNDGSLPVCITLEAKTDGLPRVRSTLSETTQKQIPYAQQVRELIENFGEAFDCETVKRTVWYDETAAIPHSPRSQRSDLNGRLRDIGLELDFSRAFETSA